MTLVWPMAFPVKDCADCSQPVPRSDAHAVDPTWYRPAVVHGSCGLPLDECTAEQDA